MNDCGNKKAKIHLSTDEMKKKNRAFKAYKSLHYEITKLVFLNYENFVFWTNCFTPRIFICY